MQIVLGRNVSLAGLRRPFTVALPEFDLGTGVIAVSGNNCAGYFTSIPVSSAAYRSQSPTHARADYCLVRGWHHFTIWDDWGRSHEVDISADDDGSVLAEKQRRSLLANGLLSDKQEATE